MKLWAFLKINIKGILKEFPSFFLSYGIFPLALALIMGYTQKELFTPSLNNPIMSVIIQDEDKTVQSKNLADFISSEEMSKIVTVKNSEDEAFDYTIIIPEGYEDSLLGKNSVSVIVEAQEKASTTMGNILMNVIDKYNEEVSQGLVIQKNIENMPIPSEEKEKLISDINSILIKAYLIQPIKSNIYTARKSLNSHEFYSITFLSFTFILLLMAVVISESTEREKEIYHRIMSTAITKMQYFNYNFLSNYLTVIIANLIYVLIYRISGLSFNGPLLILVLIILIQSLMITSIGSLISTLFKKKYGIPILQTLLIIQMAGGGFLEPITKYNSNALIDFLSKLKPDILIRNSYRNYLLDGSINSISNYLLIMLGISITLYIFNMVAIQKKWGVNE